MEMNEKEKEYQIKYETLIKYVSEQQQSLMTLCNRVRKHNNEKEIHVDGIDLAFLINDLGQQIQMIQRENEFAHSFSQRKFSVRENKK